MVGEKKFREDLYYRLSAFVIKITPLSQRREDILPIAAKFLKQTGKEIGENLEFSQNAKNMLESLALPGNVRELRHIVTRACLLARNGVVDEEEIKLSLNSDFAQICAQNKRTTNEYFSMDYRSALEAFERDYFTELLEKHGGNVTSSAAQIGMAQSNLSRKLKSLGIRKF
jgi:DNA-binding NtrC family response regulator